MAKGSRAKRRQDKQRRHEAARASVEYANATALSRLLEDDQLVEWKKQHSGHDKPSLARILAADDELGRRRKAAMDRLLRQMATNMAEKREHAAGKTVSTGTAWINPYQK